MSKCDYRRNVGPSTYTGLLARPRHANRLAEWLNEETRPELKAWLSAREDALFEHYRIENDDDPDRWRNLAIALARNHVPAYKDPPGRPSENMFLDRVLARMYHFLKNDSKRTDVCIFEEINSYHPDLNLNTKERLKAFKKNNRRAFEAEAKIAAGMIAEVGRNEAHRHIWNTISMSQGAHFQAQLYRDYVDEWPHIDEDFLEG